LAGFLRALGVPGVISAGTGSSIGTDINDAARDRIGNIYVDDETGTPNFATLPAFWQTEVSDVKAKAPSLHRRHPGATPHTNMEKSVITPGRCIPCAGSRRPVRRVGRFGDRERPLRL